MASLRAQRQLGQASSALGKTTERLASGLRVNRGSDDAAGLSISEDLNFNARTLLQGVRNVNDGISMLNIAAGATEELKNIGLRLQEIAEQSANGTYTNRQRAGLVKEAEGLTKEYNRIIKSTSFNGIDLFMHSSRFADLDVGGSSLVASTGGEMRSADGTFTLRGTYLTTGGYSQDTALADLNRDGNLDLIMAESTGDTITFQFGNGDGSFRVAPAMAITDITDPARVLLDDFTNDGLVDIIAQDGSSFHVYANNGDGSFALVNHAEQGVSLYAAQDTAAEDLNGDGQLDLLFGSISGAGICFGNGNGTFSAPKLLSANIRSASASDFDGDGRLDVLAASNGVTFYLFGGNGDGSFRAPNTFSGCRDGYPLAVADFNNDGRQDFIEGSMSAPGYYSYFQGNGDGTFKAAATYATGSWPAGIHARDKNSDGNQDLFISTSSGGTMALLGNGDGTFRVGPNLGTMAQGMSFGDVNNDGIDDFLFNVPGTNHRAAVWLGNGSTQTVSLQAKMLSDIDVSTQYRARLTLDFLRDNAATLSAVSATIGASLQRATAAASVAQTTALNDTEARSRITDADLAQETSEYLRSQIVQNTASAVLAQTNQAPALALQLLQG